MSRVGSEVPPRSSRVATVILVAATLVAARVARADRVDWHGGAGVLLPKGITSFTARPALRGDVTKVWSPRAHLELGLEAGVAATTLPYGRTDGPSMISYLDDRQENFTLLPHLSFGPRVLATPNVSLGLAVGATWLWSGASVPYGIIPYPTASAAIEAWLGAEQRFGLRAAFSYMHYWFGNGDDLMRNALLEPSLSFTWRTDRGRAP